MFPREALTRAEVKVIPVRMRPDDEPAQRNIRGQQFLGKLEQRRALALRAVKVILGHRYIDHEQRLLVILIGQKSDGVKKTAAMDIFDWRLQHFDRLKKPAVRLRKKCSGRLSESNIL